MFPGRTAQLFTCSSLSLTMASTAPPPPSNPSPEAKISPEKHFADLAANGDYDAIVDMAVADGSAYLAEANLGKDFVQITDPLMNYKYMHTEGGEYETILIGELAAGTNFNARGNHYSPGNAVSSLDFLDCSLQC